SSSPSRCARHSHPSTQWHVETCHYPWLGPSDSLYSLGECQDCPLLRASSDHRFIVGALRARRAPGHSRYIFLRPPVARAQKIIRLYPLLPYFIFTGSLVDPRLRASNEHI